METVKINLYNPNPEIIKRASKCIKDGGVAVFPADTSYGLAADYTNKQAVERVFAIKGRSKSKELSVIVKNKDMIKKYCQLTPIAESFIKKYLPGPITLIHPILNPQYSILNTKTLGVRIPGTPVTNMLSELLEFPYTATSANLSSLPPAYSTKQVLEYFANSKIQPNLFLDAGNLPIVPPSTVVNLTTNPPKILRQGSVKIDI